MLATEAAIYFSQLYAGSMTLTSGNHIGAIYC
jgi:hypothetical protein